jgi:MYXO-CTERM domain-containing protein
MSAAGDEVQILVYNTFQTMNTSGSDMVTVTVSNLPAALSGKSVFVTQFLVDETHSNPYSVWASQNKPGAPTEAQWQAMKAHQGLELAQPVAKATVTTSYSASFTLTRQAGTLLILGVNRPVTGRNALVEIEGEDYDGQTSGTKEDSNDVGQGQSISVAAGGSLFFNNVDFSDAGVGAVTLRVNAASATTLELHADSQTGTLLGKCAVAATGGSWATQSCTLTPITGVHTLYALFGGTARLNYMKFQQGPGSTGTGGTGGGGTTGSTGAGGRGGGAGTGVGAGGSNSSGSGGTGTGGTGTGAAGTTGTGPGVAGTTGTGTAGTTGDSGTAGTTGSGTGTAGTTGTGTGTAGATGTAGTTGATEGKSGCACDVGDAGGPSGTLLIVGLAAAMSGLRRKRPRKIT